nr:hypothetical protein [Catenibacterium mitsuokai]
MIFWFFTIPTWLLFMIVIFIYDMKDTILWIIGFLFAGFIAVMVFTIGVGILDFFDRHFHLSDTTQLIWIIIIFIISVVIFFL